MRLHYKGFFSDVQCEAKDHTFHGYLGGIKDFVNFSTQDASAVEEEFHNAVDDYLTFCAENGKTPERPMENGI